MNEQKLRNTLQLHGLIVFIENFKDAFEYYEFNYPYFRFQLKPQKNNEFYLDYHSLFKQNKIQLQINDIVCGTINDQTIVLL